MSNMTTTLNLPWHIVESNETDWEIDCYKLLDANNAEIANGLKKVHAEAIVQAVNKNQN